MLAYKMAFTVAMHMSIARRYGRKLGLLRHYFHITRYHLGLLSSLERLDWHSVQRLVFVCKGNICRSAYGEEKAKNLGIQAISFGLDAKGENPATEMAIRLAWIRGID